MLNESLLTIKMKPKDYLKTLHNSEEKSLIRLGKDQDYLEMLPQYIIARCPICSELYYENLDLYTLRHWDRASGGGSLFLDNESSYIIETKRIIRCSHFIVIHHFINLNNYLPELSESELKWKMEFNSEIPHVMPMLLVDDLECTAVMHSLPMCRIEGDRFIPRYTLYMISYFAPEEKYDIAINSIVTEDMINSDEWFDIMVPPPRKDDGLIWWDLKHWVKEGKLSWIEPDNPATPLVKGPVEDFPYGEISGRKKPYFVDIPPEKLG